jgi:integrase
MTSVFRFRNYRHTAASIMLSHGIPPIIVAGMLGHSLAICRPAYAHLAHFARYALLASLCSLSEQYSRDPG